MPRSLGNQEDVARTSKAAEGHGGQQFLSIPDAKTPWRLLSLDYADSFVHWVEVSGNRRPVRCGGGIEGEGFKPDDCPICQHMLGLYQDAKALRADGDEAKADKLKNHANEMRGQLQVVMKAIRGQYALMKDPKTKKKYRVADWDMEDSETNVEVGLLSLSKAQWEGLTGLIGGEDTPFIESPEDLLSHTLFTEKERRKGRTGAKYSAVVWGAEEEESEMPDIEIPEEVEKANLDDFCEIDREELAQVYQALSGQTIEDPEEDEEVEMEEDSDDDDVDEDYLSDVEGDDEAEEFEDDIPYDEDEEDEEDEEEEPPKKKPAPKKAPVKKPTPSKKPTSARKSGKTRL